MKRKQWLFIKIILGGNVLFIFWDIFRHRTYYIKADIQHLTLWQRFCDMTHNWWYGLTDPAQNIFVFTVSGIIFLILSLIMED